MIAAVIATIVTHKLTHVAGCTGGVLAIAIYSGTGYTGVGMLAAFFLLGTLATSWKLAKKQAAGLAETNKGRRTASQVVANAGVAALSAMLAVAFPSLKELSMLLVAAAFSSATADTLSSELGNIYGSRFYDITTLQKDQRGLDGVVSVEGTLCGLAGSTVIGAIYLAGGGTLFGAVIVLVAGTIGNLTDSVLGGTVERAGLIKNNAVNFLNTLVAAVVALAFSFLLH
ncbi:DUF92 domain-containing protein [Aridibaculum aurantiacum]|uniref:DUF92 domain-containing protein n=1 Tax=Aridibaculum aurantiacum TaxID=2810307 RepID=UPI001F6209AB|nr:DUF92 domain-containing protein [Aridibaculum aurantiacum]